MRAYRAYYAGVPYGAAAQRAALTLRSFLELSRGKVWRIEFIFFLFADRNTYVWREYFADGTSVQRVSNLFLP